MSCNKVEHTRGFDIAYDEEAPSGVERKIGTTVHRLPITLSNHYSLLNFTDTLVGPI